MAVTQVHAGKSNISCNRSILSARMFDLWHEGFMAYNHGGAQASSLTGHVVGMQIDRFMTEHAGKYTKRESKLMGMILRFLGVALTGVVIGAVVRRHTDHRDYAILDLEPSASPQEVQQAYRDLVQVWHPDRFAHNPRLQRKADTRMRAINAAYERLCTRKGPEA